VLGRKSDRTVWSLHHRDVEWLVTNFLVSQGLCATVWSGSRSYEDIDHVGYSRRGREVLGQTTVSGADLVAKKATQLLKMKASGLDLLMFGPESARGQCPTGIHYYSIEEVFTAMDQTTGGRRLIDRMLAVAST